MLITTQAVVIREKNLDGDRILTLLTEDLGVITAYARGAQKLRGKLISSTELLCYSRFVLFKNKDRYWVDDAESERSFFAIRKDVEKLALAAYFLQLCQRLAPAEEPAGEYLRLLLNTLHLLEKDKRTLHFLKPVFELRLLTMAGFMPDLVACAACGSYESEGWFFLPQEGVLRCLDCLESPELAPLRRPIEPGVLAAMRHILYGSMEQIFSFTLPEDALGRLASITEEYLRIQLDAPLPTLDFYHSLAPLPGGKTEIHNPN